MKLWGFFFVIILLAACQPSDVSSQDKSESFKVISDTVFQTFNKKGEFLSEYSSSRVPERIAVLATPILSYFEALKSTKNVKGVLNKDRLNTAGDYVDLGSVGLNIERLIELNPDLIICNSYQFNELKSIAESYKVLIIDEYAENNPLDKMRWIDFLGELLNKKELANDISSKIATDYQPMKKIGKVVLQLNNYSGVWYQPGCESYISNLLTDAGLECLCAKGEEGSKVVSNEEAMVLMNNTDLLVFFDADSNKLNLKSQLSPILNNLLKDSIEVLYCNTVSSQFHHKSVLQPEVMLFDIYKVMNGNEKGVFFERIIIGK